MSEALILFEQGEKIDNLVAKSDGLSAQSKMFYTQVGLPRHRARSLHTLTVTSGEEAEFLLCSNVKTPDPHDNHELRRPLASS